MAAEVMAQSLAFGTEEVRRKAEKKKDRVFRF